MNAKTLIIASLVLGSAPLAGCEEQPEARPAPTRTTPNTPNTTPDINRPSTPSTTPGTSGTSTSDAQSRAQTLILQFHQQVDSGDYRAAESTLQQLEGMKSSLPATTQQELEQLRATLRQKQSGSTPSSTTPAMPPGS